MYMMNTVVWSEQSELHVCNEIGFSQQPLML